MFDHQMVEVNKSPGKDGVQNEGIQVGNLIPVTTFGKNAASDNLAEEICLVSKIVGL